MNVMFLSNEITDLSNHIWIYFAVQYRSVRVVFKIIGHSD